METVSIGGRARTRKIIRVGVNMEKKDYDKDLGVEPSATPEEIDKAYRKLARTHHPDAGGDKESFGLIATAHAVLSDAETKKRYDDGEDLDDKNPIATIVSGLVQEAFGLDANPVVHMRNVVNKAISEGKKHIANNKGLIARIEKKMAKFKKANECSTNSRGTNFVIDTLNRKIAEGQNANEQLEKSLVEWNQVLEFIKDLRWDDDQPKPFHHPWRATTTAW